MDLNRRPGRDNSDARFGLPCHFRRPYSWIAILPHVSLCSPPGAIVIPSAGCRRAWRAGLTPGAAGAGSGKVDARTAVLGGHDYPTLSTAPLKNTRTGRERVRTRASTFSPEPASAGGAER